MTANQLIHRDAWKSLFDEITRTQQDHLIDLEVAGLEWGDQMEEERVTLSGISFDDPEDTIFVYTEEVDHSIEHPNEVSVARDGAQIQSISVKDTEGTVHMVWFRQLEMLPGHH